MRIAFEWNDRQFLADTQTVFDLSTPVDFDGVQPTFFGLPRAAQEAIQGGGFIGDTEQGGGCNCRQITLCPHGNGTHTETVQHLRASAPAPAEVMDQVLVCAQLISVDTTTLAQSEESYSKWGEPEDRVISREALIKAAGAAPHPDALIIRGLNETTNPQAANYDATWAPYFTFEAIDWLHHTGLRHLIIDLPSVDRHDDGGELPNHHRFWCALGDQATITEMAAIPNTLLDGLYLLNLQVPHLLTDAVPCRPLIMPITER
jgi:kynurenine formamidase